MDENLLVEAAKRDPDAFGELYELYFDRVYQYVAKRVDNQTTVEEVVSDIWFKILRGIGSYVNRGRPFGAWVFAVAANTLKDHYKSQRITVSLEAVESLPSMDGGEGPALDRLRLEDIVRNLTLEQRSAVLLRFGGQLSIGEIARELGKTNGAVKALLARGLESIRIRLERDMKRGDTHVKRGKDRLAWFE